MKYDHIIGGGQVQIMFADKPPEPVRALLKAHGFRWCPSPACWWRRGVTGAADVLAGIDRLLNPDRPDGACWTCGAPGRFRNHGAATPVLCDTCAAQGGGR